MIGNFLPSPKHNKNVWYFLAEKLADTGWSVTTTSDKDNQFIRLLDMLFTIWRRKNSYQVAHIDVFSGKAFIYAQLSTCLLKMLKKRIVITLHGGGLPEFAAKKPYAVRAVLTAANAVVTPSPYLQNAFKDIRSDIILIPNPIDLTESIVKVREKALPKLIWIRAFHAVYNPCMAVKVVFLLKEDYPGIELMMLGTDKGDGTLGALLKLAEDLGVKPNLQIVGPVSHSEIPRWLDKADIFINTSNYDTAPRSILEAMANGLCVVSTNVGGIPLMAADNVEALLVDAGDARSMAMAVQRVLEDPELANMLSKNARNRAKLSDWSVILPQWNKLLSDTIKDGKR